MSSNSFSHQFYQHWTQLPEPVRSVIVQELTDINTLLQPETPLTDFVFSEPDLEARLQQLYATHDAQQADLVKSMEQQTPKNATPQLLEIQLTETQKTETQKTEANDVTSEGKCKSDIARNESAFNNGARNNSALNIETDNSSEQQDTAENQHSMANETARINTSNSQINNKTNNQQNNSNSDSNGDKALPVLQINAIPETVILEPMALEPVALEPMTPKQITPEAVPQKSANAQLLSDANEALIYELGRHIDDYLSEQMTQLSEDLKSWLRDEISHQLSEQKNNR